MPNVAKVLKDEISRIARKESRTAIIPLTKQVRELRQTLNQQKRQLAQLGKTLKVPAPARKAFPSAGKPSPEETTRSIRMTPASVRRLRGKLKLSQRQFGLLLEVTANTVLRWEAGQIAPRQANKNTFAQLRKLGVREVRKRLEELEQK